MSALRLYSKIFWSPKLSSRTVLTILSVIFLSILSPSLIEAKQVTLAWDQNALEKNVVGYRVYFGPESRNYEYMIDVPNSTIKKVKHLEKGRLYCFAVTAYTSQGKESEYSEELVVNTCTFALSHKKRSFGPTGGIGRVSIETQPDCEWYATSNNPWVTILEGTSGIGNGTIVYKVEANPDPEKRMGSATFCGKNFSIIQRAAVISD